MSKQFEIVFENGNVSVTADLLEGKAPITCENFWEGIEQPVHKKLHHGSETGPEMWCFVPEPKEELPYENSTVFPEHGDILFYHYIQPPTRDGKRIFDIACLHGHATPAVPVHVHPHTAGVPRAGPDGGTGTSHDANESPEDPAGKEVTPCRPYRRCPRSVTSICLTVA